MRKQWPAVVFLITLLAVLCPSFASAQATPLRILLTNDDGYDATGLQAMRRALTAAGHHVTVSAPATDQSSKSASMTSGRITFEKKEDGVWAIHGTPADSADIGLRLLLKDSPPDLVVSGSNRGQNLGTSANSSGTVGAAVVAMQKGVPAIAVSVGLPAGMQPEIGRAHV